MPLCGIKRQSIKESDADGTRKSEDKEKKKAGKKEKVNHREECKKGEPHRVAFLYNAASSGARLAPNDVANLFTFKINLSFSLSSVPLLRRIARLLPQRACLPRLRFAEVA